MHTIVERDMCMSCAETERGYRAYIGSLVLWRLDVLCIARKFSRGTSESRGSLLVLLGEGALVTLKDYIVTLVDKRSPATLSAVAYFSNA